MLGLEPRQLIRKGEKEYKESGADNPDLSRDQLIDLMVKHPKLIERPIVVNGGKAALGRPPQSVLDIL
jgi:arsenate reductase